jgi:hypothetical protein
VVINALALERLMRSRGLDSPYVVVTGLPDDHAKVRRHCSTKYRFEPETGYQWPPL